MLSGSVVGVDVGGTKVAAGNVDGARVGHAVEVETERNSSETVIEDIVRAIEAVVDRGGAVDAVGIGVPSQVDATTGTIVSSVNIPLAGVRLAAELSARFGVPVFVDNDANCAALAEAEVGGNRFLVMYTLGTGVGGGVVVDGRIYHGATGLGAELGHVVVDRDGPQCPGSCPNRGCLEALCSGTALERDARAIAARKPDSRLGRLGRALRGHDVVAAARDGDPDAVELFERLGGWLGVGLAGAVNTFEPERIAIGGGLSRASELFLDVAVREARTRALPALAERVELGVARTGAEAGVIGAGLLARHELEGSGKQRAGVAANRVNDEEVAR